MAGYEDTKRMIIDTLMGRDPGTEIMPENHQAFALNMLDYIRSVEMSSASTLIGIAEGDTTPIQPDNARVAYIAGVAQERTVTFVNFHDINGQPISITTGEMEAVFVILLWNTAYWTYQSVNANIISAAENANFNYYLNMRKTYASVAAMNADVDSHIADDGTPIRVGETVSVNNTSNPSENAIYSLRVTSNGVYYWQEQATLPALDVSGMFNQVNANVNYLECSQNAEDEVKIISDTYFSLSTHMRLLVKMTNTNTHPTPKLNINNTGAKSIWYNGAVATDVNTWDAGEILDIYYDGTNYQSISIKDKTLYNLIESVNVGSQSSAINAFDSVPTTLRRLGLKVTWYDTVNTKWITKQYIGGDLSSWNIESNWNSVNIFGSGQALNEVKIKNENGEEVTDSADVFSAESGKAMLQRIYAESNYTNGKLFTQNGTGSNATDEKFSIALDTVPIEIGTAYRWYSELPPSGTNLCLRKIISGSTIQYDAWMFQATQTDSFGAYRQFTPTGAAGYFQMAFYGNAVKARLCKSVNGSWETVWQPQGNGMIEFLDNKIADTNTKIGALSSLTVQDKTSICTALNEVAKTAGLEYWASNTVVGSNTAILYQRDFSAYAGKTVYILCVCENMREFLSTDASFRNESGNYISYFTIFKNGVSKVSVPSTCKMVNISGQKEDSTIPMSLTVYISEDASIYASLQKMNMVLEHLNVDVNGGEYPIFKSGYKYTDIFWADNGHYIRPADGTLISDANWRISSPFVLKKGQTAYIETQGSGVCVVAKVTENEGTISYTPLKSIPSGASAGVHPYSYTATADTLIVVSAKTGVAGAFVKLIDSGLHNRIGVVEDRLDEGRCERIHSTAVGYFTTTGAIQTSKRIDWADAGWVYCPEYIPVNSGDFIKINFGKYDGVKVQCVIGYDSSKTKNHYWGAVPGTTTAGTRTISCPSDMSYIRICFFKEWVGSSLPDGITEGDPNTTPLVINGVPYVIDDITMLNSHDALSYPVIDNYGLIGKYYPKEVDDIKSLLNTAPTNNYHRFHFLHISDTHGLGGSKIFGYANDLLTYADAKFLVHTGDIVNDEFSDGVNSETINAINSCTKPFYWVLGNHDYGWVGEGGHPAVFTQYMAPMNTHNEVDGVNGETVDKTYYSIDYSTEKVKCIFLDMNDGWSDTDIADRNVNQTTAGKMSETQIRWFINELLDAATNNLHVCCFIHTTPYEQDYDLSVREWCDVRNSAGLDVTSQQAFLAEIVDAFISKTSAVFTYNGVSYTADFSAKAGYFIGWFCGHTHYDNAGFMKGHEKQFIVNVLCPQRYGNYSGGYLGDGVGVQFNYVTIDTNTKSLALYRVGCQNTIFATTRKSFRVLYS